MRGNNKKKVILFLIFLLVLVLIILSLSIYAIQNNLVNNKRATATSEEREKTVEDVLEENEVELLSKENTTLYVSFKYDLYDESGIDNQKYFENIVEKLTPFYESDDFYLIDNQKNIKVYAYYDFQEKRYSIMYNDIEGFYSKTDGRSYVAADNMKITPGALIFVKDYYLQFITIKQGYFSAIKDKVGEGVEKENGYTDYLDGTMSVRLAPNKAVKNIIFRDGYKGYEGNYLTHDVTIDTPLNEIYSHYGEPDFGNLEKGYLGYRATDYYIFYYEDEVSFYSYAYVDNTELEMMISDYIEDKDLDKFINNLSKKWKNYDYLKYDKETQSAYLLYASRGIEINIKDNDPKGIALYSNYKLTDETKKLVKSGFITIKDNEDLINVTERKRKDNTLNFN